MNIRLKDGREVCVVGASADYVDGYLALLKELLQDAESYILVNYLGELPTYEQVRGRAPQWNSEDRRMHFAIFRGNVVGYVGQRVGPNYGSTLQPHISEIWYAVSGAFRKTGLIYALIYQSLQSLNVKYLVAYVDSRNEASLNLLQKLGFNVVTLLAEHILNRATNRFHDLYMMKGERSKAIEQSRIKIEKHGITIS